MELALIFVLEFAGLLLGLALARVAFGAAASASVRRVVAAVERATRAFSLRALVRAASIAALGALLLLATGFASGHGAVGLASALGLVFGALLGAGTTFAASFVGSRLAAAVLVRAGARFDLALTTALRGAGAMGIVAQALGVLGALAALGLGYAFHRADPAASGAEIAARSALALPGYALGGALVALLVERTSGAYAAAARAGELRAWLLDASVARHEAKNPALVSALVGARLEHGAGAARLFSAAALAATGALLLGVELAPTTPIEPRFVAFPLLLWSFGLVANGVGLFVARSLEAQGALPALARGQASGTVVWLAGALGGGAWLFPDAWLPLFGASVVGWLAGAAAAFAAVRAFARRRGALRDALDGLQVGPVSSQASALGFGLGHAALALALLGVGALAAARLGSSSGVPGGERLALMLALFAAMAWSPYALAIEAGASVAETARGIGAMAGADAESLARVQRVVESSQLPSAMARSMLTLAATLAALAGSLAIGATDTGEARSASGAFTLLGVGFVLAAAGAAGRRAARGARELGIEVERQLRTGPPEASEEGRTPSYRACEELAGRVGLVGAASGATLVLLGPVVLGIALRLVYRDSGPRLAAEALATLVAGAAVTALGVALAVDGARAVLAGARRANRPEGDPVTHGASVTASALAEILSLAASPAACTAALVLTSLALLARNFFH